MAHGADLLEQAQRAVDGGHVDLGTAAASSSAVNAAPRAHGVDDGGAGAPDAVAVRPQAGDDLVRRLGWT